MPIPFNTMGFREVIFSHIDQDTGVNTDIAVERLVKDRKVKLLKTVRIEVVQAHAEFCMRERGIEKHRLARLAEVKTEFDPILFVYWGNGQKLQIEGVHRYVAAWLQGRETIACKCIPVTVWKPYIISGMPFQSTPEELGKSFSGIL